MKQRPKRNRYRVTATPSGLPITVDSTSPSGARRIYRRRFPTFLEGQTVHAVMIQ